MKHIITTLSLALCTIAEAGAWTGSGTEADPYNIASADDFAALATSVNSGNAYAGTYFRQTADISVGSGDGFTMIGSNSSSNSKSFGGIYDGGSNTLTFTATDNYVAPFCYVAGSGDAHAVIRNLNVVTSITASNYRHTAVLIAVMSGNVDVTNCNVTANITANAGSQTDLYPAGLASQVVGSTHLTVSGCTVGGTITTGGKYAGGMVGIVQGAATISNSVSSVTIQSGVSGDGTHGGVVALLHQNAALAIEGCLFSGKIVTTNGTTNCGGFLGHNNTGAGTGATIANCLYAPAADGSTVGTGGDDASATFGRNVNDGLITNSYYTATLGAAQGKQAHSIGKGEYITTLDFSGDATEYAVSGIAAYATGIKYGGVLYAGSGDDVSLTLADNAGDTQGYEDYGYFVTAGTLSGSDNPYTLTMPDEDVTVEFYRQVIDWATQSTGDDAEHAYIIYNLKSAAL